MSTKRKKAGRPRIYTHGRKEFKLCLPLALFKKVEEITGGREMSHRICSYIERGIEAEKAA